jgi:hypothetical protein
VVCPENNRGPSETWGIPIPTAMKADF